MSLPRHAPVTYCTGWGAIAANKKAANHFRQVMFGMTSRIAWKDRLTDRAWAFLSNPLTIGIYLAFAMLCAFVGSATTGVPAYLLMAIGFLLVIFVDPPKRLGRLRQRRRRSSPANTVTPFPRRTDERETMRGSQRPGERSRTRDDRHASRR
ncbi:hypothetical protein IB263_07920 [Ensifer sp. ENS03]|uniref:Uncharacterized protein n=2 Tax=Sinorhizobium/Ensifer group TaxID=227292 RepID=I0FXD9_ENSAD|nr:MULTISPECIES: hypothetical protein [unclassified Ensifer]MBD9556328.1 hypothetical protein [Ensifer sp. ENS03]MBD9568640.1 hypothetical protein [Ensifer sp. ENS08]MCY1744237.1 hypothetical protein [Ensifer sp. SL37]BAL73176.1 hypothetical protein [Ensifer adhaerens]